ncbi:Vacuolar protein-sorting-associated protein 28 [Entomophthora muscae]|nr:Vacuolar protein-sorting-associated protein 28 [Entomophthora muscae]
MEHLEKAYSNGSIASEEYTQECNSLLAQHKVTLKAVSKLVPNLEQFMRQYQFESPLAKNRFEEGLPATILHAPKATTSAGIVKMATNTVETFINTMDAIAVGYSDIERLYHNLSEVINHLNEFAAVPGGVVDFEGKARLIEWLKTMNLMNANEHLTEEQINQFKFDLEKAYNAFKNALPNS